VTTTEVPAKSRAAAWDQVAPAELVLDFTTRTPAQPQTFDWKTRDRGGVKEAIIRWLEEQL